MPTWIWAVGVVIFIGFFYLLIAATIDWGERRHDE